MTKQDREQIEEIKELILKQNEVMKEQGDQVRHVTWLVSGDERLARPGMSTKGIVNDLKEIKGELHSLKTWREKKDEAKMRLKGIVKALAWAIGTLITILGTIQGYIAVFTK